MMKMSYKSCHNLNKAEKSIYNSLTNFIEINLNMNKTESWNIGFETFGPLLYGFCTWLHDNFVKSKIKNVFFLARDGWIIQNVYKKMYPETNTSYLYVSRKSLALPSMSECDLIDDILDKLVLPPSFTIEEFLKCFDLNFEEYKDSISSCSISFKQIFYRKTYKENEKLRNFTNLIYCDIKNKIKEQKKNFLLYLKQEKFEGKVAIVDIGWHNSIQKYIQNIVDDNNLNVELNGYYLGVYDNAIKFEKGSVNGYLYEYNKNHEYQYKTFGFVSLLELMFLAHEATTISYENVDKIIPKLGKYEYLGNSEMLNIIKNFQQGAIFFVEKFDSDLKLNFKLSSQNIINFGLNPKKEHIKIFENLIFENFSNNNMVNFNHSNFYYYFHLKKAKEDFYKSGWRIVFLKKLFPIPFPHYTLFKLMCKIFL